ncbi:smc n terminal domain-containing protein [Cystoisospora suis]|uniref:Smc n terminal domain-containing protein n=1 Tax=Cystoisospora suis TaxID=483139 RepID=A0A2C6KSS3_9APIC|nr:smc n terminal domain-containing protein [Cystoisospora suis]
MMDRQHPQQQGEEEEEKTSSSSSSSSSSVNDSSSVYYPAEDSETFCFSPSLPPSPSEVSSGERAEVSLPPHVPTFSSQGHHPSIDPSESNSLSPSPPSLLSSSSSSQVSSSLLSSTDRSKTVTEENLHPHADKENSMDLLSNSTGREEEDQEREKEGRGANKDSKSFSTGPTEEENRDLQSREEEERSTMMVPWRRNEREGEMPTMAIVESPLPLSLPSPPSQTIEAPRRKRLMIERVVLENFKSYGKQKVIGPFHKHFTAIVGPNGSGKSNVIDAMLFVFGRRAQQIRLKNVVELIHNSAAPSSSSSSTGGKNTQKSSSSSSSSSSLIQSARVTIFFQEIIDTNPETDEYEVVENSKFLISREVSRLTNSTEYRVNGQKAQQKQVIELLKSKGLDLQNNRFLILQGEVEQISLMKPKASRVDEVGLLEYLEELVGSNRLIEPIEKSQQTYEDFCQQYQEKSNRCRAAGAEMKHLETAKNEALKHLQVERKLQINSLLLVAAEGQEISQVYEKKHKELRKYELQKKEDEIKGNKLSQQFDTLDKELEDLLKRDKKLQTSFNEVDSKFNKLVWKDEELRNELFNEAQAIENKNRKVKENDKKREEDQMLIQSREKDLEEKRKKLPEAEEAYEKAKEDVESFRETIQDELKSLVLSLRESEEKLAKHQATLDLHMKNLAKLNKESSLLEKKKLQGEQEWKEVEENLSKMTAVLQERREGLQYKSDLQKKVRNELKDALEKRSTLHSSIQALREQLQSLKGKAFKIEARQSEKKNHSRVLQFLLQKKKQGEVQGLHDRLGELGSIDKKYERAFLAAGGGFCSYLVVEEPHNATDIFNLLRHQDLGRVNCFALQVLERDLSPYMQRADAEENWRRQQTSSETRRPPRLIDLIHFKKDRYRVAFYKAVGDTVVANDMDEASAIAYTERKRGKKDMRP